MSEGGLVSTEQSSSLLTKIVQVDPLYVEFSVPEAEAVDHSRLARAGQPSIAPPTVRLVLENGRGISGQPPKSHSSITPSMLNSGTVRVRAVLKNPEAQLIPGQFIRARVEGVQLSNVVAVPRKAVMSSAQGQFIWLVNGEQKVEFRPVQVGRSFGNNIIVTEGLAPGDRYIVEGVLKVQPGIQVSAVSPDAPTKQAEQQQPAAQRREKETA